MDLLPPLLQLKLHTLVPETNKLHPTLQQTLTLGLPLSQADHPPPLLQLQLLILVPIATRLLPMLLLVHILGLHHSQVDH